MNEGVVPLIEMRFPPPGTLVTPVFPAPTNARTFVILRLLGVLAGVLAKATDGRVTVRGDLTLAPGAGGEAPIQFDSGQTLMLDAGGDITQSDASPVAIQLAEESGEQVGSSKNSFFSRLKR